jgi:outer membrane immunogenic protein
MKAPVARAAAPFWTGWNLGVSLGGRWAVVDGTTISFGGGPPPFPALAQQSYDSATFRVGGYLGYDWQIDPRWVVGLEGDFAWGDGSKTVAALQGLQLVNTGNFSEFRHTWDAGIRGRVGYLLDPTWLLYLTGGIQWQHVEATVNCAVGTCGANAYQQTNSTTRTGWTLGGGLEKMLPDRWLVRVEYRYGDYGTWRTTFGTVPAVVIVKDFDVTTHTALLGIGKKF